MDGEDCAWGGGLYVCGGEMDSHTAVWQKAHHLISNVYNPWLNPLHVSLHDSPQAPAAPLFALQTQ